MHRNTTIITTDAVQELSYDSRQMNNAKTNVIVVDNIPINQRQNCADKNAMWQDSVELFMFVFNTLFLPNCQHKRIGH